MEALQRGRSPIYYARVAGWIHLTAMGLALFSQMYVPMKIVVPDNVSTTALHLSTFAGLYRIAITVDILVFLSDVVIG